MLFTESQRAELMRLGWEPAYGINVRGTEIWEKGIDGYLLVNLWRNGKVHLELIAPEEHVVEVFSVLIPREKTS